MLNYANLLQVVASYLMKDESIIKKQNYCLNKFFKQVFVSGEDGSHCFLSAMLCLHTVCDCIALCLCSPDPCVTVLVTAVPFCRLKSFSYDSMWDSRCV